MAWLIAGLVAAPVAACHHSECDVEREEARSAMATGDWVSAASAARRARLVCEDRMAGELDALAAQADGMVSGATGTKTGTDEVTTTVATAATPPPAKIDPVAAFPAESADLAAELKKIAELIAKRDWETALPRVQAARTRLSVFVGTNVASSPAWLNLDRQVTAQQKRIQAELDRIETKKKAEEAAAQKARDAVQAEADARGPMPDVSPWNGSYQAVDFYLKERLKDPDSYEPNRCLPPRAEGAFWVVACSYRAKNSFGATVLEAGQFYIRKGGFAGEGEVVRMEAVR